MTIDISKIKIGDAVTIKSLVTDVDASSVKLASGWHSKSLILSHTPAPPKPLEVGDMVSHRYGSSYGTLAYVSNDGKMGVVETPFGVILYDMIVLVRAE